jgi:hypothetical protein
MTGSKPAKGYEIFSDMTYYDLWAARTIGERDFNRTLHFSTQQEAVDWTHDPTGIIPPIEYNIPIEGT